LSAIRESPAWAVKEDLAASLAPSNLTLLSSTISARVSVTIVTWTFCGERRSVAMSLRLPAMPE
jgi:hypothetical protein